MTFACQSANSGEMPSSLWNLLSPTLNVHLTFRHLSSNNWSPCNGTGLRTSDCEQGTYFCWFDIMSCAISPETLALINSKPRQHYKDIFLRTSMFGHALKDFNTYNIWLWRHFCRVFMGNMPHHLFVQAFEWFQVGSYNPTDQHSPALLESCTCQLIWQQLRQMNVLDRFLSNLWF